MSMYIPPGFTVLTCEVVDEAAFQSWAILIGGVWCPAEAEHYSRRLACATWVCGSCQSLEAKLETPSEENKAEWALLIKGPVQSVIDVELSGDPEVEDVQWLSVLRSLFTQWDSTAYDLGAYDWVSVLLRDFLPAERIVRREPPLPGPAPTWVWVNGIYKKNEAAQ